MDSFARGFPNTEKNIGETVCRRLWESVEDGERVRVGDWERDGRALTCCRIRQPRPVPAIVE